MRKRAFSITRKTITVAVAAALLSISAGAETLTPPRITGSMENPADDVIVTYEDITTGIDADGKDPDLSFIYVPVQPESGSPMTLTLRSLTVDNQITAGWVPVNNLPVHIIDNGDGTSTTTASSGLYRKNGAGIATNTDAGITLDIAGDLTVNARTTAIAATAGSSITGTIGGNFTVKSQDTGIAVTEATLGDGTTQNLNLAILGPSSSITATGPGFWSRVTNPPLRSRATRRSRLPLTLAAPRFQRIGEISISNSGTRRRSRFSAGAGIRPFRTKTRRATRARITTTSRRAT